MKSNSFLAAITFASTFTLVQADAYAQGGIVFKNFGAGSNGYINPIAWVSDPHNGKLFSGTGYSVQLYYGPPGATSRELIPLASSLRGFLTGSLAGLFGSPILTIPGIGIGEVATFQVRAWDNYGGTIKSWEGSPNIFSPASNVFEVRLGDPASLVPGGVPTLVGLQPFGQIVPEPSTTALTLAGGAMILFRKRSSRNPATTDA